MCDQWGEVCISFWALAGLQLQRVSLKKNFEISRFSKVGTWKIYLKEVWCKWENFNILFAFELTSEVGEILQIMAILSHVCLFLGIFLSKFVVVIFIFVTYDHWSLIFEIQRFYRIHLWTSKKNKACCLDFWKSFEGDWKRKLLKIQR